MQKDYEILYLVSKKQDKDKTREKINSLLTKTGVKIIEENSLSRERFAYPIKKEGSGYFLITQFLREYRISFHRKQWYPQHVRLVVDICSNYLN